MMFHIEHLCDVWDDFEKLATAYWVETEEDDFNIDKERFLQYNDSGFHLLYTARDHGMLCGYAGIYLTQSMYTHKKIAIDDAIYLMPEYRKGRNGIKFFKYIERDLFDRQGVDRIVVCSKEGAPASGRILEYIGGQAAGFNYAKNKEN